MELGRQIKKYRGELGLSQEMLAENLCFQTDGIELGK